MNEDDLSFQICKTPEEFKSAEDGYQAVLEGLEEISPAKPATRNLEGQFRYSCGTEKTELSAE